jgi:hypothetical protein
MINAQMKPGIERMYFNLIKTVGSKTIAKIILNRLSYAFSSTKLENKRVEQVLPGSGGGRDAGRRQEVVQTMYTHVNKCKNDKIKEENP